MEIIERVLRSARYRHVERGLVARLAAEELPRARNDDDAVKRVKRRLHQAIGAFQAPRQRARATTSPRDALVAMMRTHASTRERLPHLDRFHAGIWETTGIPRRILDLGCGLHPLSLPWMGIGDATYLASDVDERALEIVRGALADANQPHEVRARDLVTDPPTEPADVALLLKLVTTLDRQDPDAATRLVCALDVRHVVVSFATRSLGGRGDARAATYRARVERLAADAGRIAALTEASVPNELVFVLDLHSRG